MPKRANVKIDRFLTNLILGYRNEDYVLVRSVPTVTVSKEAGKIPALNDDHYRLAHDLRQLGGRAGTIDLDYGQISYSADERSLEFPVDDRLRGLQDDPIDVERDATMALADRLRLRMEYNLATLFSTTANYASGHTNATARNWSTTGDPIGDVQDAIATIVGETGISPNSIYGVCSYSLFRHLKSHSDIKAVYANTTPGASGAANLTAAAVASALGLAGLEVVTAVYNTAKEGATASFSYVFPETHFAVYVKRQPSLFSPNFAMRLAPSIPGLPRGADVAGDRYRDESIKSDVIRATVIADEIVGRSRYGYLYTNAA